MRPQPFLRHLTPALRAQLPHGPVVAVRTHLDIGRREQPEGLRVETSDGWGLHVQVVGVAGDGGFTDDGYEPVPDEAYERARAVFEAEPRGASPARGARPPVGFAAVLDWLAEAAKGLDLDELTGVEVREPTVMTPRPTLRVEFADGSAVFGLPLGVTRPGSVEFTTRPHEVPREVM